MGVSLRGLDPLVRERAELCLQVAEYFGVPVTVTSTFRSWNEQQALYDRFKRGQSQFPANRPGDSAHGYGWAWDSVVAPEVQDWWDSVRRWAGFEVLPNDRIHAEVPNWRQYL